MQEPALEQRIEVARRLNRGGVSAAPLSRLPLLSIFDDDEYENYDFDVVSPRRRLRIGKILTADGFRQASGSRIESPNGGAPILFPKPGILGSDPSRPAADLLARGGGIIVVTPTQALLLYLHRFGPETASTDEPELTRLVWEQPANLDKVHEWARAAGHEVPFSKLRPALTEAQAEGIDLRRRQIFRSQLPR
ncbi:MAG: hypothetical protein AAF657_34120 [Acidobacteriota bacterium]